MLAGKKILAVVPARSGSKGIPDKNMKIVGGQSLIASAANCLNKLDWIDMKILSTDSKRYSDEGKKYGLQVPFLRPSFLSNDTSTAVDTMIHALQESEIFFGSRFDILLIIEPTSPFRIPEDVENTTNMLISSNADSSVCVSPLNAKYHPLKSLQLDNNGVLSHYEKSGNKITARQQLDKVYARNGICYALSRNYLLDKKSIFGEKTVGYIVERNFVNIDEPLDLEWAEFLLQRELVQVFN